MPTPPTLLLLSFADYVLLSAQFQSEITFQRISLRLKSSSGMAINTIDAARSIMTVIEVAVRVHVQSRHCLAQ